jgi:uncharacterized membrane protein YjgN (DUF898 family)
MTDSILPPDAALSPIAPQPAAPAAAAASPGPRFERFRFSGSAREYFGIWIVNLFLTVITLGIYSAWAKVRKKRYFYGNTWLADSNFEYHGNPVAILKGRLLAFAAFIGYTLLTHYSPRHGALLLLALMPAVPWIIVRSFAFNAVNSSYRNLRFHFDGRYRGALAAIWPFVLVPLVELWLPDFDPEHQPEGWRDMWPFLITPVVFMLLYPYVVAKVKLLQVNHGRFGTAGFECSATVERFYVVYLLGYLLLATMIAAFGATIWWLATRWMLWSVIVVLTPIFYLATGAIMLAYTRSRIGNLVFNTTSLAGRWQFRSTLEIRRLAVIYATNLLAIAFTLGLMIPWAAVRTARYRADCLALEGDESLDAFVGDMSRQVGAAGEEMGEMFDVDLSL